MENVNLKEAAELVGKSERTLHRYVVKGKLSRQDNGTFQIAELIRVFGELKQPKAVGQGGQVNKTSQALSDAVAEIEELKKQLHLAKTEADLLRQIADDRQSHIDSLKEAMRLIEHKVEKPKNAGWFSRLFNQDKKGS